MPVEGDCKCRDHHECRRRRSSSAGFGRSAPSDRRRRRRRSTCSITIGAVGLLHVCVFFIAWPLPTGTSLLSVSVNGKVTATPSIWLLDATLSNRIHDFDPPRGVEASSQASPSEVHLKTLQLEFENHCREKRHHRLALDSLKRMLRAVNREENEALRFRLARMFDDQCQVLAALSFTSRQGSIDPRTVWLGWEAIQLQLASERPLPHPYNLVPKHTLLIALKALANLGPGSYQPSDEIEDGGARTDRDERATDPLSSADAAFRILQRLVTGTGVRTRRLAYIAEHDFNMVVNAYVSEGRVDLAHRVVALQERTPHAPPLSAVTYSILAKGYGMLGDTNQVTNLVRKAAMNRVQPDVVMMNSVLDAYVNCRSMEDARRLFQSMKGARVDNGLGYRSLPPPTLRTYNIFLKGLANDGLLDEAVVVAKEMMSFGMKDPVTTNILVHAAIVSGDYERAEVMLADYTADRVRGDVDHPNVEAYTELIDTYAKDSQLDKALTLFRTMKERGVEPNEITFTCLVSGLARKKEISQAKKMIRYMSSVGIQPTSLTYGALMSGLLGPSETGLLCDDATPPVQNHDSYVDEALWILRDMIQEKVPPSPDIVSTLVRALAECTPPRVEEAKLLIKRLEGDGTIARGNVKVATSLIQAFGKVGDAAGCVEAFRSIKRMDTIAVNSFLDACCRCGRDRVAFDSFDYYFRAKANRPSPRLKPDVISYSILISALLNAANSSTIKRAQSLYEEMKTRYSIVPDRTLIDLILKAFVRIGRSRSISKDESIFVVRVLRDAENISWSDGQLDRRKRAVRALVGTTLRDAWLPVDDSEDDLFKRKGWNQVDSSFRLWGSPLGATDATPPSKKVVDRFLESKGWNDVDSGFRII